MRSKSRKNCSDSRIDMEAAGERGMRLYKIYRAISYGLTPLINLHIRWRRLKGLEHRTRWPERLGQPSIPRPSGPLIWFHAVSLGEGMAAMPVIRRCVHCRPDLSILMTTTTLSAFEVIKNQLPTGILYQFSPLDTPAAIDAFLDYWKPNAIMIMENELWPNLIMSSWRKRISLALLNARISTKSFRLWSQPLLLPLISLMLSKFSLIVPLSNLQAIHFQILEASPSIINFAGDLKYAVEYDASAGEIESIEDLKGQLAHRKVWMAASIHKGEEKVMLGVHKELIQSYPDLVTIIVPRYPKHGQEIAQELQKEGKNVASRSQNQCITPGTHIYVVDTIGELRHLYRLSPIAVIGGSFLPGLTGHNISEAATAGCAVLTGHYVGHFSQMIKKMQQLNPLSVTQVHGALELEEAIMKLFGDPNILEAHCMASKQVSCALSSGIITNVWNLLNFHVFRTIFSRK